MLRSMVCRYQDFFTPWYEKWSQRMHLTDHLHRKGWEWCAIVQTLEERDMLRGGRAGCGFAVGREPLTSLFASLDTKITATDAPANDVAEGWVATNQHATRLEDLYRAQILPREVFQENVRFQPADMRDPATYPRGQYDFIWSSCALEHLGTLDAGHRFVLDSTDKLLKPKGVAVHTTEFNISSNDKTIEIGPSVVYRRRDLDRLEASLRRIRCGMIPVAYDFGMAEEDLNFDFPPFGSHGRPHIKLLFRDYVITSALIIIHKG
jgi:hypothetical protein